MPLLLTALTQSPGLPGVGERDYPATIAAAAQEWASAVQAFAAGLVPPSTTVAAATSALQAALQLAFTSSNCAALMDAAFQQFAVAVAAGQAPTFTGVPPPSPVGFATIFAQQPAPSTRAEGVARVASKIDAWMRTGLASMVAPPKTVQPWS